MPTEAGVERRVSQAAAAKAHSIMTSIKGPEAAKACAAGGTHMGRTARALSQPRLGTAVASRERQGACQSR